MINTYIILNSVAKYYDVRKSDICSTSRLQEFRKPRHVFFYLSREFTKESLNQIGSVAVCYGRAKKFDHATVINGHKSIDREKDVNKGLKSELNEIILTIKKEESILDRLDKLEKIVLNLQLDKI